MNRPRILLSGRDVGAGLSVAEFARFASASRCLEVIFVAQDPLLSNVQESYPQVIDCTLPGIQSGLDEAGDELRSAARDLLWTHRPDAVLVSLSGPGAGIDEALLSEAQPLPRYAFQDYWGDINASFGAIADCFFVLDDQAAKLTRERCGRRCVVAGSPKHARVESLNVGALRRSWRAEQGLADDEKAIVFFGQPFWQLDGYAQILNSLVDELRGLVPSVRLYYRLHPKEDPRPAIAYIQKLEDSGLDVRRETGTALEAVLSGADLVLSCFSTVGYDLLMLNRCAPEPLAATLYLLCDPRLRDWYEDKSGLGGVPLSEQGLALLCTEPTELPTLMHTALSYGTREKIWRRAARLPDPAGAAERMMQTLLKDLRKTDRSVLRAEP